MPEDQLGPGEKLLLGHIILVEVEEEAGRDVWYADVYVAETREQIWVTPRCADIWEASEKAEQWLLARYPSYN